jgi:hypothetical protein
VPPAVGQFSYETVDVAERKILQYPRGTAFLRQELAPDSSEAKKVAEKLGEFLAANGMKLKLEAAAN